MKTALSRLAGITLLAVFATPALAHHPLGGLPMDTFWHGLASGVGHPVLGFDHLFFVIAAGIAAAFTPRPIVVATGFVGAICLGVVLGAAGLPLPAAEIAIALSLLVVGGLLAYGKAVIPVALLAFGLFHGTAFSEALAGQESTSALVLAGYLIGLGLIQAAIAIAAGRIAGPKAGVLLRDAWQARLAGAGVAGMGLLLVLESVEGAAFAVLGL